MYENLYDISLQEGIRRLIASTVQSPYRQEDWSTNKPQDASDIVVPSLHVEHKGNRQGCILLDKQRRPKAFRWTSYDFDSNGGDLAIPLDVVPAWWYQLCTCDAVYWYLTAEPWSVAQWYKENGFVFPAPPYTGIP